VGTKVTKVKINFMTLNFLITLKNLGVFYIFKN